LAILLILRGCSSDLTLLLPGVREEIVHKLFTVGRDDGLQHPADCQVQKSDPMRSKISSGSVLTGRRPIGRYAGTVVNVHVDHMSAAIDAAAAAFGELIDVAIPDEDS
jgi:hypothetical protein